MESRPGGTLRSGQPVAGGGYRVVRLIGRGVRTEVYEAEREVYPNRVAIKILAPEFAEHSSEAELFLSRASAIGRLDHWNVASVYDLGRDDTGLYFIATELHPTSVNALLSTGEPVPVRRVLRIVDECLSALAFAHDRRILHLNLKPTNILLNVSGNAVLTDFAVGWPAGGDGASATDAADDALAGRLPPELFRADPHEEHLLQADQFALGVVMLELLTGRRCGPQTPSLDGITGSAGAWAGTSGMEGAVVDAVSHILERALSHQPGRRYQSPRDMQVDIRAASSALETDEPELREGQKRLLPPPEDEPTNGVPISIWTKLALLMSGVRSRWVGRTRGFKLTTVITTVALLLAVFAVPPVLNWWRELRGRRLQQAQEHLTAGMRAENEGDLELAISEYKLAGRYEFVKEQIPKIGERLSGIWNVRTEGARELLRSSALNGDLAAAALADIRELRSLDGADTAAQYFTESIYARFKVEAQTRASRGRIFPSLEAPLEASAWSAYGIALNARSGRDSEVEQARELLIADELELIDDLIGDGRFAPSPSLGRGGSALEHLIVVLGPSVEPHNPGAQALLSRLHSTLDSLVTSGDSKDRPKHARQLRPVRNHRGDRIVDWGRVLNTALCDSMWWELDKLDDVPSTLDQRRVLLGGIVGRLPGYRDAEERLDRLRGPVEQTPLQQQISGLVARGTSLQSQQEWEALRNVARKILVLSPGNSSGAAFLGTAGLELELAEELELADLVAQCERLNLEENWEQLLEVANRILGLRSTHAEGRRFRELASSERELVGNLTPEQQKEITDLLLDAEEARLSGRFCLAKVRFGSVRNTLEVLAEGGADALWINQVLGTVEEELQSLQLQHFDVDTTVSVWFEGECLVLVQAKLGSETKSMPCTFQVANPCEPKTVRIFAGDNLEIAHTIDNLEPGDDISLRVYAQAEHYVVEEVEE